MVEYTFIYEDKLILRNILIRKKEMIIINIFKI